MTELLARNRSAILLILGIVLALATAGGLYLIASGPREPASASTPTEAEAVVAAVDIKARTVLTAEMVKTAKLPITAIPASAARLASEVLGQTALADIPAGALLLKPQLLAAGGQTGQSITIEAGKVLVAFPTNDPLTLAGLVSAGDHVDLLATVTVGETGRTTQTTIQGLEVVQVLGPSEAAPNQPRALTFVVDHQVALFLKFLRDSQAAVEIAVRSRSETETVTTQHVDVQVLEETFGFK